MFDWIQLMRMERLESRFSRSLGVGIKNNNLIDDVVFYLK